MTDGEPTTTGVGQANGKAILLGEHAVIYGAPALAIGIGLGAQAWSRTLGRGPSRLLVRGWNVTVDENDDECDLARAFRAVLATVRREVPNFGPRAVEVEAYLPPQSGLGCSAAIGVAIARALDRAAHEEVLQERAMEWERVFHGNPSGVDAAVAARGGCVWFQRGAIEHVHLTEPLWLCIGHTGTVSSTKAMVDATRELRSRDPKGVNEVFDAIASLVRDARRAIGIGDHVTLGDRMNDAQSMLRALLLSTPPIERMCTLARSAGAFGAKLTGAGGGGSVVALAPDTLVADAILAGWTKSGYRGFATCVAEDSRRPAFERGEVLPASPLSTGGP